MIRKASAIFVVVMCVTLLMTFVSCSTGEDAVSEDVVIEDIIEYEGKQYVLMPFAQDLFYYCYNGSGGYEEDIKYVIEDGKFEMLYYCGDLYCLADETEKVANYYVDSQNYNWYITIEEGDAEKDYPITITFEEEDSLYTIEGREKGKALFFDEIENFATLKKVSHDNIVQAVTELAYHEGKWYWRSEIIDESREKDETWPEYVYELQESLSDKITEICEKSH